MTAATLDFATASTIHSRERRSRRRGAARTALGYLGLAALPLGVIADTGLTYARGWRPAAEGAFGKLPLVAVAAVALCALPLVFAWYRGWLASRCWQFWLASASVVAALVAGELAVPHWIPTAAFHLRPPGAVYRFDPDYAMFPGMQGPAVSAINAQGLRQAVAPPENALRLLCLGGSTTECSYLDSPECWPQQVAEQLKTHDDRPVWTATAAVDEYASGHHLRFLRSSPLVEQFEGVVLLVGAGDLVRAILGYDAGQGAPPLWLRSQPIELLKQLWNVKLQKGLVLDYDGREYIRKRRQRDIAPPRAGFDPRLAAQAYADRIGEIIVAAKERGIRLILVTQPTLWDDYLSPEVEQRLAIARTYPEPRAWEFLRPGQCREAMDRFNLALKQTADKLGADVVDAAVEMSGDPAFFYDDCHLNESGCRRLGELIADHWRSQPTPPRTSSP